MRINRLDLTRYGKFTDRHLDFGSAEVGRPDLHVIYGPNEAGKSTALSAFLDLLFGIETRSRYGFLHPYSTMRVGAALDLGGVPTELVRIKKPQNSLLGPGDLPVSEGLLAGELGGVGRDAYCSMFSLDDDTLEKGGESILASRGDLGQLLFSATSGLASLGESLIQLRVRADGIFKLRSRSSEIGELKNRLSELKERRDQIDTLASHYGQMVETRDRAKASYDHAMAERAQTHLRLDEIRKVLTVLPRLAELRGLRLDLAGLPDVPEVPASWAEDVPILLAQELQLGAKIESARNAMLEVEQALDSITVDDVATGMGPRMEGLVEAHARYLTAERDLPERRLQMKQLEREIEEILRLLGRPEEEPGRVLLNAETTGMLRDLLERRSGIVATLENAKREADAAMRRLVRAREKISLDPAAAADAAAMAGLVREVSILREDDHAATRRVAERTRLELEEELAEQLLELRPWAGSTAELKQLVVPTPADLEAWRSDLAKAEAQIERFGEEVERLTSQRHRVEAELEGLQGGGSVSEDEAAAARAAREASWARHRDNLDEATAAAFELALRKDDLVTGARILHVSDAAKFRQVSQTRSIITADLESSKDQLTAATAKQTDIRAMISRLAQGLKLIGADGPTFGQLELWLKRRDLALGTAEALRKAEVELRGAESRTAAACDRLLAALSAAAVPHDPSASYQALLATAQAAVDLEAEQKASREELQRCESEEAVRSTALLAASADEEEWGASWAEVCRSCWLGDDGTIPKTATVKEIMNSLAELAPASQRRNSLADRVAKMEHDQALFSREVSALAAELGVEQSEKSVLELWGLVSARVVDALSSKTEKLAKHQALQDQVGRCRELEVELAVCQARKAEMTRLLDVSTLQEVERKLRVIDQRKDVVQRCEAIEREIKAALSVSTVEGAEELIDSANRLALEAEQVELLARFEDQDKRVRELHTAYSKASDQVEAVDGDSTVAALEEQRRTILLEIEDRAFSYFRLRAGIAAADRALRLYRERHRSSMMLRASDAFRTISRGAYSGLATQPDRDSEVLIGVAADGSSKLAQEMSKGTRFQLYLALRVAGYQEFAQTRASLPFVADDIMETFDDFRAEEAFRLFAEMARMGQVIYLTHHQHLCEIARKVCPDVQIHELATPPNFQSEAA